jgi:Rrf2 family protein
MSAPAARLTFLGFPLKKCNFGLMLSKKAKYAVNALVYLAQQPVNQPIHISTIATNENISRKFLESILLVLRNAGMVNSKKGKEGGYYLLMPPEDINMADVMRIFDGPIALLPCVTHKYYQKCNECKDEAHCGIRDVFSDIRRETVRMLKDASLAEIVKRATALSVDLPAGD